ncbi:MAG: translation initiation factor [Rhabdochlamydiaceae bacterium]|nr:translation initiation factor [Candidatus Amphrikana amoebophyrae]
MAFTLGGDYIERDELERKEKAKKPIKISKERRKNKMVTVIHNLPLKEDEIKQLLKILKTKLGTGGTIKEDSILIQGDRIEETKKLLQSVSAKFGIKV